MSEKARQRSYSGWWLVLFGVGLLVAMIGVIAVIAIADPSTDNKAGIVVLGILVAALVMIGLGLWTVVRGQRLTIDENEPPRYGKQSPLYKSAMRRREQRGKKAEAKKQNP
jgi:hypothetical protein